MSKGSRVVRGGLPLSSLNIEEEKKGSPAPEKPYTTMNKPPARASEARKEEDLNFVAPMNVGEGEEKLVRDVLWCLQGIDGKHCVFRSSDGTFAIDRRVCGRLAWLDRARELCELGWLYRKVSQYANSGDSVGLVEASLRSGLSDELAEYYRLIAVLEARLNRRQDAAHRLSLRRLTVWTLEPLERLKTMASLTDAISEARAHGGAILSILHARTKHGDPQVHDFLESLAQRTAEPMFAALRRWLFAGELAQDPHKEFFVFENEEETTTAAFWRDRYALRSEMVPSFIRGSEDQILLIGKALNFLKRCSDGAATTSPPPASSMEDLDDDDLAFRYNGEERLARLVRRVAVAVNGRIRTTLVEDFRLVDHLRTLRACLLLMQGDFAVRLVDAIEPHRAAAAGRRGSSSSSSHALGGAASVVRHNVWTAFDSAVRASNAVTLRTLDCLRVAIVRGRDDVVLDYEPPSPVDAVVDQEALAAYRAAHSVFLRRIRVEHQLSKAWRHHMTAKRVLSKNVVFHRTALARARIAQLVTALGAYYCSVVDDNWRRLEAIVDKDASGLVRNFPFATVHFRYRRMILLKRIAPILLPSKRKLFSRNALPPKMTLRLLPCW